MWLIDTNNLRLVGVQGDPQEDYAILSHTWGADEVTFSVFQALNAATENGSSSALDDIGGQIGVTTTAGYRKIKNSAEIARKQRLKYLWVDTCCIDKTSSAELSESINSMYRWYQKAKVCYAFLEDVQPVSLSDPFGKNSSFRKSRWFTRGWTLQELIAPATVQFYAQDWSFINAKQAGDDAFRGLLTQITGINESLLAGKTLLSDVSVANRMQWAALRQTTRIEDMAYCLLGLFNVNMPLLYGEGMRAFTRLQEEILKETDDQSVFLWGIPPDETSEADALYGLLAPSPHAFCQLDLDRVRPLPPSEVQESTPATVTSQGLRTSLLLFPVEPESDDYYAMLDCVASKADGVAVDWNPGIMVRRLWGDQFARITSSKGSVVLFPEDSFDEKKGKLENVYVRQNPFYALPEVTINPRSRRGDNLTPGYLGFKVSEAYPPDRWDSSLSVIRPKEPQSGRPFVVLRFAADDRSPIPTVDVAIGLRRIQKRWELCYEKHAVLGDQLQRVYQKLLKKDITTDPLASSSRGLGFVNIAVKATQRRGRRFIQLELSGAVQLDSKSIQNATVSKEIRRTLSDEISEITRTCCVPQKLAYILPKETRMVEAVRTKSPDMKPSPGYYGLGTTINDVEVDESKPYANMIRAVRAKREMKIKSLVSKDRSLLECETEEFDRFRPIHWAAGIGSQSVMKTLIKLGVDQTSLTGSGLMAIHVAVLNGHFNLVAYLLEEEACLQPRTTPDCLHRFLTDRQESVMHVLVAPVSVGLHMQRIQKIIENIREEMGGTHSFAHRNWLGETPLHLAAATGEEFPLKYLMDVAGHPDAHQRVDRFGRSVLFHAACGGNRNVIKYLAERGASVNLSDDLGRSPLHAAVTVNNHDSVSALLNYHANPTSITHKFGLTPLHFACLYGHSGVIRQLSGSTMDRWSAGGLAFQPLHLAVANGHESCVSHLLDAGCQTDSYCNSYLKLVRSKNGVQWEGKLVMLDTPLKPADLAFNLGFKNLVSMLKGKVVKTNGVNGDPIRHTTSSAEVNGSGKSNVTTGPLWGLLGLEMLDD
ncbi:Vegetative incompatibility protein HET-E-1 [Colletotrichum gloeosporioides]|uniref:Vegetative incompatibility protein HET-E-1 n=1 Tax=Colletotrichum gloeosporioides TaxID=474922 RepID=A0A8H4CD66_COLGL|nr:Vegetative incompatibility protein HET-E-1 [Colletotrichum gloeosporioides]KAF3801853.1 Vegetative incompatibility protein HET-E-1 [Colletotrichum gloeosporioides]